LFILAIFVLSREGSVIVDFIIFITQVLTIAQSTAPDIVKEVNTLMIQQVQTGSFGSYTVSIDSLVIKGKTATYLFLTKDRAI
jgi:hypothetical protein